MNYISQILLALIVLANLIVIFTKASASAVRVSEVFALRSTAEDTDLAPQQVKPDENTPKIEFRDVSFSYNGGEEYTLSGVSVKLFVGQTLGIIGGTGAGKSTFINLIPRFYDVTKGEILLDGVNIKRYPLNVLRKKVGIVPQKAALFSGTVRQNMRWRKEQAEDAEIEKALETAQAADFVHKLSHGLDTQILQGGKNLSGGQKQRLTIARALVGTPEILILDDSTSALDYATDAALRRALAQELDGMTVIMVSQRASTLRHADTIMVLDDGTVAGIGTHEELTDTCEVYREICMSQLSKEEANV